MHTRLAAQTSVGPSKSARNVLRHWQNGSEVVGGAS